jgi:hypothetical protein
MVSVSSLVSFKANKSKFEKSLDMRNSSTCLGKLAILSKAILNPLEFSQLGNGLDVEF